MTNSKQYFISLISSFLNNKPPEMPSNIDWQELYTLGNMHNVTAIIANEIMLLPEEARPEKQLLSCFQQQLGYTIISYESKSKIAQDILNILTENEIAFILVKGAVLKSYYPVEHLRTSSDIDIIIKRSDFERARTLFSDKKYENFFCTSSCIVFSISGEHIEVHSDEDYDNEFFANIFEIADNDGLHYYLNDELHLLYVLCHIAKHFSGLGAGMRMFMDVDVIIRHMGESFDYDSMISLCRKADIEVFAQAVFSLCNFWFGTPVKSTIDFNEDKEFLNLMERVIIDGGVFGDFSGGTGDYYVTINIGKSGKSNLFVKLKALKTFFFPSTTYLKKVYLYSNKHPVLIPLAWFNRLFDGLFKRRKHSAKTLSAIFSDNEFSETHKKLLDELDIHRESV